MADAAAATITTSVDGALRLISVRLLLRLRLLMIGRMGTGMPRSSRVGEGGGEGHGGELTHAVLRRAGRADCRGVYVLTAVAIGP